ncbi:serine hydrolase [bacterium]|nr:serine hydrolase [bacterium]
MRVALFLIISLLLLPLSGKTTPLEANLQKICTESLNKNFFSAVSISVWKKGKQIITINQGVVNSNTPKQKVTKKTLFDLASLTKPMVITSLFLSLEKRSKLKRSWKVSRFFPEIKQDITLYELLTHTSSLPPYDMFYKMSARGMKAKKKRIIDRIAAYTKLFYGEYSDINYILLGFIIEKVGGKDLDALFQDFLTQHFPFKNSLTFTPLKKGLAQKNIAATYTSRIRKRVCQGEVEDENSAYLGGISGHAGLFGTADDVSHFFSLLLKKPLYRKNIVAQIGFDKKEGEDSNYGSFAKTSCSGHLGWSGTAFLICPQDDIVITILTNRTHSTKFQPANLENIKLFRQQIFDAILFDGSKIVGIF